MSQREIRTRSRDLSGAEWKRRFSKTGSIQELRKIEVRGGRGFSGVAGAAEGIVPPGNRSEHAEATATPARERPVCLIWF